jgi:hypothetical protein
MSHRHQNPETSAQTGANRVATGMPAPKLAQTTRNVEGAKGKPISEDEIRLSAYRKWERAGRPPCDGVQFWLEAKRELAQVN